MCNDLVKAIDEAQGRADIGCILISAAGSVFCSGMDLDETGDDGASAELLKVHEKLFTAGATSLKPIIVSVNGPALAGGLGLVAQGHVVIASESAVFGLPEIRIGFWPFVVYRSVEAALGVRRTLHSFHAREAADWGLVHQICPAAELNERAKGVARELGKSSPLAIRAGLEYVHSSEDKPWRQAGEIAASLRAKLMESDDFKEGIAAFKYKREPHWPSLPLDFYATRNNPPGR
jgi:enoyl-CoA hydratase/carnithine racemase